jgi:hypothetical protein
LGRRSKAQKLFDCPIGFDDLNVIDECQHHQQRQAGKFCDCFRKARANHDINNMIKHIVQMNMKAEYWKNENNQHFVI